VLRTAWIEKRRSTWSAKEVSNTRTTTRIGARARDARRSSTGRPVRSPHLARSLLVIVRSRSHEATPPGSARCGSSRRRRPPALPASAPWRGSARTDPLDDDDLSPDGEQASTTRMPIAEAHDDDVSAGLGGALLAECLLEPAVTMKFRHEAYSVPRRRPRRRSGRFRTRSSRPAPGRSCSRRSDRRDDGRGEVERLEPAERGGMAGAPITV